MTASFDIVTDVPRFHAPPAMGAPKQPWNALHHAIHDMKPGETLLIVGGFHIAQTLRQATDKVRRETGKTFQVQKITRNGKSVIACQPSWIHDTPDPLAVLERAVDLYGKPGGPWNVPSEPGTWISDARASIKKARAS